MKSSNPCRPRQGGKDVNPSRVLLITLDEPQGERVLLSILEPDEKPFDREDLPGGEGEAVRAGRLAFQEYLIGRQGCQF